MRYRVTNLWSVLANEERPLRWLARKSGCSHAHIIQLRNGRTATVSEPLARRIAEVLRLPMEALFAPVNETGDTTAHAADWRAERGARQMTAGN